MTWAISHGRITTYIKRIPLIQSNISDAMKACVDMRKAYQFKAILAQMCSREEKADSLYLKALAILLPDYGTPVNYFVIIIICYFSSK